MEMRWYHWTEIGTAGRRGEMETAKLSEKGSAGTAKRELGDRDQSNWIR